MIKSQEQIKIETERRKKLMNEKPYVMEKLFKYKEKIQRGECIPIIEIVYDYKCNMKCTHCGNSDFAVKDRALTPKDVAEIARQADELGLAQFSLTGGEPLLFNDLDELILAINPKKFHIAINTNGFLLDKKMAIHLKKIGVDKIKVSLDSIDENIYDITRQKDDGYNKAMDALFFAKEAGLQVVVQTVVSHQTCISNETERLAKFCYDNCFNLDIIIARAVGRWEGREDVLIDEEDAKYIWNLHKKYPIVHRDTFPAYDREKGCCGAIRSLLDITKYGDVMPCALMQISIGNIFEQPLKDIIAQGMKVKYFANPSEICLSGEDRNFIRKYLTKCYGKALPVHYKEIFLEEDFLKGDK